MKKVLLISLFLFGCTKVEIEPIPSPAVQKIFTVSESTVINGQTIYFDLPSDGIYTLTYVDVLTGQVISREKFSGKSGENIKKIYTKSIMSKYLYLILASENKTQISKTKITLN
jgi:hypothetical protein